MLSFSSKEKTNHKTLTNNTLPNVKFLLRKFSEIETAFQAIRKHTNFI